MLGELAALAGILGTVIVLIAHWQRVRDAGNVVRSILWRGYRAGLWSLGNILSHHGENLMAKGKSQGRRGHHLPRHRKGGAQKAVRQPPPAATEQVPAHQIPDAVLHLSVEAPPNRRVTTYVGVTRGASQLRVVQGPKGAMPVAYRALIDTGAFISMVSRKVIDNELLAGFPTMIKVGGFGGEGQILPAFWAGIVAPTLDGDRITGWGALVDSPVVLLPDDMSMKMGGCDVLLGMDVIGQGEMQLLPAGLTGTESLGTLTFKPARR